ncbi:MAG: hypothetical protein KGH60_02220 [Candidatus Micrarchaeota archaeon]|nr:hypothetical protein [Candidatus Micrarchaeota archaeon]
MDINDMVIETRKTWKVKPSSDYDGMDVEMLYSTLGIGSETGELENLVKKYFRKKYYTDGHSFEKDEIMRKIEDELADVLYYTFRVSDLLKIDLGKVFTEKMAENARRYNDAKK